MLDHLHQLNGFEFANLTLLIGVLVAANLRRVTNINPGGIVAGAFLILAFISSVWWALALLLASIFIAIAYRCFFSHIYIGRQPMFIMAGMSVALMSALGVIMQHYHLMPADSLSLPLGLILPAILAATIYKQGVGRTFTYTMLSTLMTAALLAAVYTISLKFGHDFHQLDQLIADRESLHLAWSTWLSFVSIIIGLVVYKSRGVKSAGYIVLPMLASILLVSPLNFGLIVGLTVVIYAIIALVKRHSLLVGVGRYSFILAVAIILVWTAEYVLLHSTEQFSPFMGTSVFAALAIAVIVNEHNAYGVRKAAPALALSLLAMACIEIGGITAVQSAKHQPVDMHDLTAATEPLRLAAH